MARKNYLHAIWRIPCMILWMCIMPLLYLFSASLRIPNYQKIPHVFHRGMRFILGLKVQFYGEPSPHIPTIYVSNHISYLDVFVLGDIMAFYIAKSEVANWPILGRFARFQNTLFIERNAAKAKQTMLVMQRHLEQGNNLILFPEGTSTEGQGVRPFKSSLFEAAKVEGAQIQPITVAYTHYASPNNKMNQSVRDYYAWYASMPFASHFFHLFFLKKAYINVFFHPVCTLSDYPTRKQCADACHKMVEDKLREMNA